MKKFGRGYVLDFAALMDEVRQPPEGEHGRTTCVTSGSVESNDGSPTTPNNRSYSSSSGETGNQSGSSSVDLASPTEEESPNMSRMPIRMSVSRTGRCKNRDRQRLTVLHTEEFYRVPSDGSKVVAPSSNKTENDKKKMGTRKVERDSVMTDGVDNTIQAPVMTDCYSF